MNQDIYYRFVFLICYLSLPMTVIASDFNVLTVGLAALTIALVLIVLCIKGISAARKKPRNEVTGYSLGSFFLSIIGITMILQEKSHMSSSDFYGLMAAILILGSLAFILPLVLAKPHSNEADKK